MQSEKCFEELTTAPSPSASDPCPLFFLLPDFPGLWLRLLFPNPVILGDLFDPVLGP